MKVWYIERNDFIPYIGVFDNQYDKAIVVAESPDAALELLIDKHGKDGYNSQWGLYDVKIVEIVPNVAKIWIEHFNAG